MTHGAPPRRIPISKKAIPMKQTPLSRLVMAALFAALTCIATLVIQL